MNVDFSNRYTRKDFSDSLKLFTCMFITFSLYRLILGEWPEWSTNYILWLEFIFGSIFIFVCPLLLWCRNRYVFIDNVLMVEEHPFIFRTFSYEVLVSHIKEAKVVWSWHRLRHVVRFYTSNDYFDILCTTHRQELVTKFNELCLSNKQNNDD